LSREPAAASSTRAFKKIGMKSRRRRRKKQTELRPTNGLSASSSAHKSKEQSVAFISISSAYGKDSDLKTHFHIYYLALWA